MKESSINETIKLCCDIVEDICARCNADEDQLQDCYCNALETINSKITMELRDLIQLVSLQTLSYFDEKESLVTCPLYIAQKIKYTFEDNTLQRIAIINLLNKYNRNNNPFYKVDKKVLKNCNIPEYIISGIEGEGTDSGLFCFIANVIGGVSVESLAKVFDCKSYTIERNINYVEYALRRIC